MGGKEGHIKCDCPSLKYNDKNKTHKAKSMMCEDAEDSESTFVTKEENLTDRSQQEFSIDSGASKHMTCDKEILQEYPHFSKTVSETR